VVRQTGGLVQVERGVIDRWQVVEPGVPERVIVAHHLADVAAEPDRLAALDRGRGNVLDDLHVDVEIDDRRAADDVAEVLDGEGPAGRAGRPGVVDQADVLADRQVYVPGGELLRGEDTRPAELLVLVRPLPVEALRRRTQMDAQDPVDDFHDPSLGRAGGLKTLGRCCADSPRGPAELIAQDRVHPGRVRRALRLWHVALGHQAVLGHQSGEHVPLAAVTGRRLQQVGNRSVVEVAVCGLDDRLEEVIGALELVPEHHVVLRELELLEPAIAHHADAQQVQPGKQPAATAPLLIRDLPVVQRRRHRVVDPADDLPVDGDVVDGHPGHGILGEPVGRVGREILAQSFQITGSECFVHQSILSRYRLGLTPG
jgi:hypothetical protein